MTELTERVGRASDPLFERCRVSLRDERVFVGKLAVLATILATGAWLALQDSFLLAAPGVVLLAAGYTHGVELQHQCLHHSAFRRSAVNRFFGVPLGLPLLVSYSHYRVRHLQHHRYLGTPNDTEFFGFDTRQGVTWRGMLGGLFDYPRVARTLRDIWLSWRNTWRYTDGQSSERMRQDIVAEYRFFGAALLGLVCVSLLGGGEEVLRLWLLPLAVAVPLHFLVELPEHLLCETESADVLRNTRSISGSWFSTWFTNGNNLHVEHHAAMTVPINRLRERHPEVERRAVYVTRTYPAFYWSVCRALMERP
ncbi:fatty acid desaturase [Streptomyces sp. V3I7]|uniref:fatty acid desaturase family protein n=1 Tax=Streptomyces sp. V3I7 TaxID=3042278 RepID=UPI00278380AE|nr:fatty acid desaturase [Streptomyces sp. V3I7]MDQ0992841.1 fatty acid desaturase [Streptomyces sp. V3I7]